MVKAWPERFAALAAAGSCPHLCCANVFFAEEWEVDGEEAIPTHPGLSPGAARVLGWRKLSLDRTRRQRAAAWMQSQGMESAFTLGAVVDAHWQHSSVPRWGLAPHSAAHHQVAYSGGGILYGQGSRDVSGLTAEAGLCPWPLGLPLERGFGQWGLQSLLPAGVVGLQRSMWHPTGSMQNVKRRLSLSLSS